MPHADPTLAEPVEFAPSADEFVVDSIGDRRSQPQLNRAGGTLTQQLINELGIDVVRGGFNADQGLHTELSIAEKYQISRSVAREAVKALIGKGLLCSKQKVGILATPRKEWNIFDADVLRWMCSPRPPLALMRDLSSLCLAIMPDAASMAARRRLTDHLYQLQRVILDIKTGRAADGDSLSAETEFFLQILSASGNAYFAQIGKLILPTFFLHIPAFRASDYLAGSQKSLKQFQEIYEFLRAQDSVNAGLVVQRIFAQDVALLEGATGY